jgi:uncharacterized membrane protein YphA (DoxX/SURF4 family)
MNRRVRSWLFHPWLSFIVRVGLGAVLIYASYHKIADPPDFAKVIYNYKLVPPAAINLLAIYLPWVEAFTGAALILGVGYRGAALAALVFFCVFIAALGFNLARECPTICGCFGTHAAGAVLTDAEKFAQMRTSILRDSGLALLALYAFAASFFKKEAA